MIDKILIVSWIIVLSGLIPISGVKYLIFFYKQLESGEMIYFIILLALIAALIILCFGFSLQVYKYL